MPTSADRFVLAFRHWLNRYAGALSSSVSGGGILIAEMLAFLVEVVVFDLFQPVSF
jgi:hypothetical protein